MTPKLPKFNLTKLKKAGSLLPKAAKGVKSVGTANPIKSIGMQLLIIFFVVIVIGVSTVGLISYNKSKDIIQEKVANSNRETVRQVGEKLDLILKNYENLSMQAMTLPELSKIVDLYKSSSELSIEELNLRRDVDNRLQGYMNADNRIAGISLIPLNEKLPLLTTFKVDDKAVKESDWFKSAVEAKGKGVWIGTTKNGPSGSQTSPSFGFARVIMDIVSLQPNFIMLVELKEDILQDVGAGAMGEGGELFVVSSDSTVLSSPRPEEIGTKLALDLKVDERGGSSSVQSLYEQDLLISHQVLPKNGWQLVGTAPYDTLVKETKEIFGLTMIMTVIGALAAIAVGWVVMQRVGKPLQRISALMRQAEGGDLSVRSTQTGRSDEIGVLARSFNEMIGNIRDLVERTNLSAEKVLRTASELAESSRRTAASASEIATATEEIAGGATNLAVEAEKGTDLTIQMGERMKLTIDANVEMAASANEVQRSSVQGTEHMRILSEKTSATEELTRSMVRKVEVLKESTGSIRKILDTLNNMTRQTNILALNATIEAARAGAAGRGFMVVADEIRKLADQSKQNIDSVGQMTEGIRKDIEETVLLVSEAYPMFREQIEAVKETDAIFNSVNERMGMFIQQLDAVTDSISNLDQTQRSLNEAMVNVSAVAEESSATSQEVAGLSSEQLDVSKSLVELAGMLEDVSKALKDSLTKFSL